MGFRFDGKLIDVSLSQDGKYANLVFEHEQYDYQLKRSVPRALRLSIADEHRINMPTYKNHIGDVCSIECDIKTSKNGVWYSTAGDGMIMEF